MNEFKFNLGEEVKDKITGFKGIVICQSKWINGCNTYGAKSQELKDGLPQDTQYFDEPQLISLGTSEMTPQRTTGGPCVSVPSPNRA